jgi:tetratricopeptide (TPR) repeat protein
MGHCYLQLNKYKDALSHYYKLDALDGENPKIWRAIAWCSFVSCNIKQAEYYSNKLLENEPTSYDLLNAGHIAWIQRRLPDAVSCYLRSLDLQQNNWEEFMKSINEDKLHLLANGIDADEIPLMLDELLYKKPI